jgi:hypothetical protein
MDYLIDILMLKRIRTIRSYEEVAQVGYNLHSSRRKHYICLIALLGQQANVSVVLVGLGQRLGKVPSS